MHMGVIKKVSDWKKTKYDPWKEETYNPWKEESFKPWKEKKGKQLKNWAFKSGKNIGNLIHTFGDAYRESKTNKRDGKNSGIVVKIGNIENLHIGNKLIYNNNELPNTLSNKELNKLSYHQFNPNPSHINENYDIFAMFENIKRIYRSGNIREVILKCEELLEIIMTKIALVYNFQFKDLNQFLFDLARIAPSGKKLILYDDFIEYSKIFDYLCRQINPFNLEIVRLIFTITETIIEKLKNDWSEDSYKNFKAEIGGVGFNSWISPNKKLEYKRSF